MVYRITFICDESDAYRRVFEIDSSATFLDLHKAIIASNNYTDDQMTSFYLCDEDWEKEKEITLVDMQSNFEVDTYVMENTTLDEMMMDEGQKMMFVFDPMFERCLMGKITAVKPTEYLNEVVVVESKGKAPKQLKTEDDFAKQATTSDFDLDADLYGDSEYDEEELDPEGFGDMNFDDSSLF